MAVEGGVFVSKEVHDQLANQKEFEGVSLGLQSMKGVGRLIEVYGLKGDLLTEPNPNDFTENCCPCCNSKKEVPSIAIIPFRNKGKKKDEFYAYGICTELISDCSGAGLIRVASLEQVEELGDLTVNEKANKLDVRYIATGTLWRMDDMFQLSIELYDSKEKKVIWSDNWEENWDELPMIKGIVFDGILKVMDTTHRLQC
jgi:TolB-like protein